MSSYFCSSTEEKKKIAWVELHLPLHLPLQSLGHLHGEGESFWGGSHPYMICSALPFVMGGKYIHFVSDKSQATMRFMKKKMSLRIQRSKTIRIALRWTGVR